MKYNFHIFCDCGAPSLYNKLSRKQKGFKTTGATFAKRKLDDYSYTTTAEYNKYRDDYIAFIHKNKDKIDTYSNLDVINNPQLTFENQKIIEAAGLNPIPVWHLGNSEKWLQKYVDEYPHIAVGGIFPNPTSVIIDMLNKLFPKYILDKDGFPRLKVHGFGCTAITLMERYPWYSVDSATARKLGMFGWMANLTYDKNKVLKISNDRVSDRDSPLIEGSGRTHKYEKGFQLEAAIKPRLLPEQYNTLQAKAKEFGMHLEGMGNTIMDRVIWNYLVYRIYLNEKLPPKWPWNYYTREVKEGATEEFIMYLAGLLSASEEETFWEAVSKYPELHLGKGRLQSFFYKKHVERIINLRETHKQ